VLFNSMRKSAELKKFWFVKKFEKKDFKEINCDFKIRSVEHLLSFCYFDFPIRADIAPFHQM
jgi:hypothetical protein